MPFFNLNSSPPDTPAAGKCATVTMMLANQIARSNWSVDDEHFFETNTMNVWQTLEFLSGIALRKRYHYEGYNDTENIIRTLTPSWRRDSFVEKTANPAEEGGSGKYPTDGSEKDGSGRQPRAQSGQDGRRGEQDFGVLGATSAGSGGGGGGQRPKAVKERKSSMGRRKKRKGAKKEKPLTELDSEYAMSPLDYTDLVKCSFNLPRISARLERLMGTNVVRLTDRKYMKELRERIEEDYRIQLQKRIKARELKEVERERVLIIEGKSNIIPPELSDDPIFVVNEKADIEIQKQRAKLKTNREKNSERLKLQGAKWERERLQHEEEERLRLEVQRERMREQKELEERYKEEDAERGMDLLRIDNEDWRACEQKLKEFLERERDKMKERSLRVPTPFTSDPQDIQNIVRARQKFRETEQRIRHELEENMKTDLSLSPEKEFMAKSAAAKISKLVADDQISLGSLTKVKSSKSMDIDFVAQNTEEERLRKRLSDDTSEISSSEILQEAGSSISESKRRHAQELEEEMEADVARGLLISKDQYDHLRYEEAKILQLRQAADIRELYQLAEEIIHGDRIEEIIEEEEVMPEEEEELQIETGESETD